ncbi:gluconolactonase [Cryobacterium sp. LW097]|uniref:SMP-30/gluconolactonase/LRE family protein n=1 Tax=unclassified Cryobacterium TaxID=2649013 RepID=UPI000B4C95C8|nr:MULTISPECIES: SMP-30/gluconolactonase/LRE family protein [unclassified Cryobacterium]ASD22148.1 gluconolactonase [Cryobacterium sp. LW097]TFC55693.1 SMP-30/gluconolactonase/LRE family protein [Cryobacterium sp. TMB3-1-2]TFC72751.1 SMP-30/gluconolactonase/LRE family protein [Cryobacterium sp. TMB3-15]TFC76257.1 SMP-30/gluconolactonase/LRE family protein [Cryobacterium sp. TMB3-10]TFD43472.1 SMP-30/gluconolactonase/LRE family protein [Cryobacterium sp. TMB3-12]
MRAEQLTDPITFHGEGPVFAQSWGGLRLVDLFAGDVLSLAADGTVTRRHVDSIAAALRPRVGGGAVIALERGFALEDADGTLTRLPEVWADPSVRMNDGGGAPDGSFFCGSMAYDQRTGAGSLYRLAPDGSVELALAGVTISNGLAWSPDGSLAYYNDTPTGRIGVFDWAPETGLTGLRPFVDIPSADGYPDGLTVDSEGGVWVALYAGGAVRRYSPEGTLDEVIEVAAQRVTACTFGGDDLRRLYITTSREGLAPGEDPLAGSVFTVTPGVAGLAEAPFAG